MDRLPILELPQLPGAHRCPSPDGRRRRAWRELAATAAAIMRPDPEAPHRETASPAALSSLAMVSFHMHTRAPALAMSSRYQVSCRVENHALNLTYQSRCTTMLCSEIERA